VKYEQPAFYHFNEDSFILIDFILEYLNRKNIKVESILDMGSGCGVIGIELGKRIKDINKVFFIEKQVEFKPFLEKNLDFIDGVEIEPFWQNWDRFNLNEDIDLIVSNPPYYLEGKNRISTIKQREICRSISEASIKSFLQTALNHMHAKSTFFFCVKNWKYWKKIIFEFKSEIIFEIKEEKDLIFVAIKLNKQRNKVL